MSRIVLPLMTAALFAIAVPVPAKAASTSKLVEMCVEAMDAQGVASRDDYRAKMKKVRGGALKKLTLQVIPNEGDGDSFMVECQVRRGEVVSLDRDEA